MKQHLNNLRLAAVAIGLFIMAAVTGRASAGPLFDTSTPLSFFTNVASRLLSVQMNLDLGHLQIYPTNQYTPAVHRLLQVTANIWDAENTNYYPTVFRPLFESDEAGNIFICGYLQVTNVSGTSDPQLALPYAPADLLNLAVAGEPITDSNGPVNVYGVPWVLGAKKGLPNFNQLSLVTAVQISRKLEVSRDSVNPAIARYVTNQMYVVGISNSLGAVFWNSYAAAYPRPVTVSVSDQLETVVENSSWPCYNRTNLTAVAQITSWPGSVWSPVLPPNSSPSPNSFLAYNWPLTVLPPEAFSFESGTFVPLTDPDLPWDRIQPFPHLTLTITNYFQGYILDGSNVIDYVELAGPSGSDDLANTLADPNYPQAGGIFYQWSTNLAPMNSGIPNGVLNQIFVSQDPHDAPITGGQWSTSPTPTGATVNGEAAFFSGFFKSTFQFDGMTYVNSELAMMAPYTPSRCVYTSFLLQANDPLVHYLVSDLNGQTDTRALWGANYFATNGGWGHSDDLMTQPLPPPPLTPLGGRYQPWGRLGQIQTVAGADANVYNLAYKDPGVWGSDNWNFPTGQSWNLNWLGQVHRGTPWQTIFLKSTNVLAEIYPGIGGITWAAWTGDIASTNFADSLKDALESAPINDWTLVSWLAAMLDTNDLNAQFPISNPDPGAWAAELDGLIALTNTLPVAVPGVPLQFSPMAISSNSPQAAIMASSIQTTRTNRFLFVSGTFPFLGAVLATPALSVQSPFLNLQSTGSRSQLQFGLNDQAYEAIPSQLLPLLRIDPVGNLVSTNGQTRLQFTGYDNHRYAIQCSSDLLNWTSLSTNSPVNGMIDVPAPPSVRATAQFYRTVLVP